MTKITNVEKAVQSALKTGTAEGCMTREELAKAVKGQFARGRCDLTALTNWLGNGVKLGLFDTDTVQYRLKRGITGGIEAVKPKVKRVRKAPSAVQPVAATVAQA